MFTVVTGWEFDFDTLIAAIIYVTGDSYSQ